MPPCLQSLDMFKYEEITWMHPLKVMMRKDLCFTRSAFGGFDPVEGSSVLLIGIYNETTPHNAIIRTSQTTHCSQPFSMEYFLAGPDSQPPIVSPHYFPFLSIVPKISKSTFSMFSLLLDSCIPL